MNDESGKWGAFESEEHAREYLEGAGYHIVDENEPDRESDPRFLDLQEAALSLKKKLFFDPAYKLTTSDLNIMVCDIAAFDSDSVPWEELDLEVVKKETASNSLISDDEIDSFWDAMSRSDDGRRFGCTSPCVGIVEKHDDRESF